MKFEIEELTHDEWLLLQCIVNMEMQTRTDFPYYEGETVKYFEVSRFMFVTSQCLDHTLRLKTNPFNQEKAMEQFKQLCSALASKKVFLKTPEMEIKGNLFHGSFIYETKKDMFVDFFIDDEFIYEFIRNVIGKQIMLQEAFLNNKEEVSA